MVYPGLVESLASRVTRNVCVGPAPRSKADFDFIIHGLGCTAILNLCNGKIKVTDFEEEPIDEEKAAEKCDMLYKQVMLTDGEKLPLEKIKEILKYQAETFNEEKDLYIHCHAGISRSPSIIAIIMIGFGHDPDESRKFIERMHPATLIHPVIWEGILEDRGKIRGLVKCPK